ncbi:PP2C family protein-serine/threonine phosphatase [bacterium]|nr:PP2C family protein-serine/threonine phosphatase [bacterium]
MHIRSSVFQNIVRFTVIFITMGGIFLLAAQARPPFLILSFLTLLVIQIYSLMRYNDKTNRDLARLFAAVHHHDFSESFSDGFRGGTYRLLSEELNRVITTIREIRSRSEAQSQYLNTIIQQAGTGLLSVREDGTIDLINTAAKKMLGAGDIHTVRHLAGKGCALEALLTSDGPERTMIIRGPDSRQLAASSVKFRKEARLFTLISLHDISNELEHERLSKELDIARQVQLNLSPRTTPRFPGLQVEGYCSPAEEVGGDYYDFISRDRDRLGIVIGDVSGKGVPAAFYTTLAKGMIQSLARGRTDGRSLLVTLNQLLYEYMEPHIFLTLFFLDYTSETREIRAFSAGHNPAVYYCARHNSLSFVNPPGIALGLHGNSLFASSIRMHRMTLEPGDLFILYTDGFTEAMNSFQEPFGEERLLASIRARTDCPLPDLIERVHHDVIQYTAGQPQSDDMTMVALKAV